MLQSVSLPTIIVFERHWDAIPKQLIKNLLSTLADIGYNVLCYESPQNVSSELEMSRFESNLKLSSQIYSQSADLLKNKIGFNGNLSEVPYGKLLELIRLFVSSQRFYEVTERIKDLPGQSAYGETRKEALKLSFLMKGIDIDDEIYSQIFACEDPVNRVAKLDELEDARVAAMFKNLLELQNEKEGVIFICGASHAENLVNKYKAVGLQDRLIYLFPHSDKSYSEDPTEEMSVFMNDTLKAHLFCLKNKAEILQMEETILKDVKAKNIKYKGKIDGNISHISRLTDKFGAPFEAFLRPGHYVDALVDVQLVKDVAAMLQRLEAEQIPHSLASFEGCHYLVIPAVNTASVAEKICRL